jgi:hypothetical protein
MVWRGRQGAGRGFSLGAIFVGYGWLSACAGRSVETPNAGGNGGNRPSGGSSGAAGIGAVGGRGGSAGTGETGGQGGIDKGAAGDKGSSGGTAGRSTGGAGLGGMEQSGRGGGGSGTSGEGGALGESGEGGQGGAPDVFEPLTCTPDGTYPGGLLVCAGDFVHRPEARECERPTPDTVETVIAPRVNDDDYGAVITDCQRDVDCGAGAYCIRRADVVEDRVTYRCYASCATDSDCDSDQICVCDAFERKGSTLETIALGRCASASCVTDADCGAGSLCISSLTDDCGYSDMGAADFHCQSAADECNGESDCSGWSECVYDGARFSCSPCLI